MRPADYFIFVTKESSHQFLMDSGENTKGKVLDIGNKAHEYDCGRYLGDGKFNFEPIQVGDEIIYNSGSIYHSIENEGSITHSLLISDVKCFYRASQV